VPFTIPDQGEGDSNLQSIIWQEEWDVLLAGISGIDCVLSGLAVTGGADMTPAVAKGAVLSNRTMFAVAAADVTISAADATNPRLDLIVVNNAGALAVRTGTPGAFVPGTSAPKPPARSANDVVIAIVYVPATDTAIATTQIIDKRVVPKYPLVLLNQTTARSQNTSAAAVSIFSTPPVIPNGLFLAGRALRVRAGGNLLHNTATSWTLTVIISYGGTTIFNDVCLTSGTTAESDRIPWTLDFTLVANGNADQRMFGSFMLGELLMATPTTGTGNIGVDENMAVAPIGSATGGIAVDSDTANRTLDITFTMSSSNALHEWVCQGISVELL
jgi:hypothetical protein